MAVQGHPVVLRSPNLGVSLMPLFLSLPHIHPLCVPEEQIVWPDFRICPDLNPPPTPAATTLLGAAVRAHLTAAEATPLGFLHPPSPFILRTTARGILVKLVSERIPPAQNPPVTPPSQEKSPNLHRGLEGSTPAFLLNLLSSSSFTSHHPPSLTSAVTQTGQIHFRLRALAPAVLSAWNALPADPHMTHFLRQVCSTVLSPKTFSVLSRQLSLALDSCSPLCSVFLPGT